MNPLKTKGFWHTSIVQQAPFGEQIVKQTPCQLFEWLDFAGFPMHNVFGSLKKCTIFLDFLGQKELYFFQQTFDFIASSII